MFHPIYWELQVSLLAVLFVVIVVSIARHVMAVRQDNARLAKALQDAWDRERYRQVLERNRNLPEDWSLRGLPAGWEGAHVTTGAYSNALDSCVSELTDEEFASMVLLGVERRLSKEGVNDKVFTRLAGRVFRKVEKQRKGITHQHQQ